MAKKQSYEEIIKRAYEAVERIKEQELKKLAFEKLLEDALSPDFSFGKSASPSSPRVVKKTNRKKSITSHAYSKQAVRKDVAKIKLLAKHEGLKPYGSLEFKWMRYLFVLEVARQQGLDALTNSEIAFLINEKFRQRVTEKQVNNLRFKVEAGFVEPLKVDSLNAWRILDEGIKLVSAQKAKE